MPPVRDCVVCMDRPRTVRFRPCRHCVCCASCCLRLIRTGQGCPVCHVPVEDVEEVVPGAGNQDTFVPLPRDVPVDQVRHLMIESRPTSALLLSQWGGGNLLKPHRHSHEVVNSLYV